MSDLRDFLGLPGALGDVVAIVLALVAFALLLAVLKGLEKA